MKEGKVEIFSSDQVLKLKTPPQFIIAYIILGALFLFGFIGPFAFIFLTGGGDLFLSILFILLLLIVIGPIIMRHRSSTIKRKKKGPIDYTEVHDEYIRLVTRKTMSCDLCSPRSYNNPIECMDIPLPQIKRLMRDSPELHGLKIRESTNPDKPGKGHDWRIFIELNSPLRMVSLSEEPVMFHRRINNSSGNWAVIPIDPKEQDLFIQTVMRRKEALSPVRSRALMEKVNNYDLRNDIEKSIRYESQPRWEKVFPTALKKNDLKNGFLRLCIRYSTIALLFTILLGLLFGKINADVFEATGSEVTRHYINAVIGAAIFSFGTLFLVFGILIFSRTKYISGETSNTFVLVDNWFVYIFTADLQNRGGGVKSYMNFFQRGSVIDIEQLDEEKLRKFRTLNPVIGFFLPKNYTNIAFHNSFSPISDLVLVRLKRPFYFEHTERITSFFKPFDNLIMSNEVIIEVPRSVREKFKEAVFKKYP